MTVNKKINNLFRGKKIVERNEEFYRSLRDVYSTINHVNLELKNDYIAWADDMKTSYKFLSQKIREYRSIVKNPASNMFNDLQLLSDLSKLAYFICNSRRNAKFLAPIYREKHRQKVNFNNKVNKIIAEIYGKMDKE